MRAALLSGGTGTGQTTWGGSANDKGVAVARDSAGNIYALGATASFGAGGTDILITKLGPSGIEWARTWGGTAEDVGTSIAVGPDGNLYVTGTTSSFGVGSFDMVVMKVDTAGTLVWAKTWGATSYDAADEVTFDAAGNLLVVGQSYDCTAGCSGSAIVLKLDAAGGEIWSKAYKSPATYDVANTVMIDGGGNIVVAGTSWDYHAAPHNSILVMKTDSAGNLLWHRDWSSPGLGADEVNFFRAVASDAAGNIYIAGRHTENCPVNLLPCDFDPLVLKVSANGALQWARIQTGAGWDAATSIALDAKGRLFVSGIRDGLNLPAFFLDQYDTAGTLLSRTRWNTGVTPSALTNELGMLLTNGHALIVSAAPSAAGEWKADSVSVSSISDRFTAPLFATNPTGLTTSVLTNATVLQSGGVVDQGGGGRDLFLAALPLPADGDVNIAFNPTCSGSPSPLESDRGWGGGAQPCQIVDGLHQYDTWASGLAFTGGHYDGNGGGPWVEPAGVRHAVIDF
ncbi:MAG TPA: SBBP repeat-containing protein, partial [Polyangia bacterium]|nr:SBBP repeat-containing protein [Polyangia bacterium]